MSTATTTKPATPAVRLSPNFHRVVSITAARRGMKIKDLVEEVLARDAALQIEAKNEGISLAEEAA